ncbi:MAG TPA: hypothetical protein K8V00_01675 [Ligilactobacillus acidipiscis]|uniref:Uncharacterized protein n=1 Tax=Ligilactobacillus acidipiscis TaxID=89059 RepID=A0A921F6K9_9LACO|nr:hypothetical protein [Ligilactobacillus acidipiscis]
MKHLENLFGKALDQSGIFKLAHKWTRNAFKHGAEGDYIAIFSEYLHLAYEHNDSIKADYEEYKNCRNRVDYIEDAPTWLLSENLSQQEYQAVQTAYTSETVRETVKAKLIAFSTDFGRITCWVPKSVIKHAA